MQHPLKPGQIFKLRSDPPIKLRVLSCELTGGGCAHGPHDTYADGHYVTAVSVSAPRQVVTFYQSGDFRGIRRPVDVEWIDGPPDAAGQWITLYA